MIVKMGGKKTVPDRAYLKNMCICFVGHGMADLYCW